MPDHRMIKLNIPTSVNQEWNFPELDEVNTLLKQGYYITGLSRDTIHKDGEINIVFRFIKSDTPLEIYIG